MFDFDAEVDRAVEKLHSQRPVRSGTLVRLVGLRLEARGIMAPVGACCEVLGQSGKRIEAEVVGFADSTIFLMPFSEPVGIGPGDTVRVLSDTDHVLLGDELLGRVIDARGRALDGKPQPACTNTLGLLGLPLNPMERGPIDRVLDVGTGTGVLAIAAKRTGSRKAVGTDIDRVSVRIAAARFSSKFG